MAASAQSPAAVLSAEQAKVVLAEVIKAFGSPENAQRMDEARDNACNDMGKMLQFLLPVATQIQQDVIKAYGFSNDGEGGWLPAGRGGASPPAATGGRRGLAGLAARPLLSRCAEVRPADQVLRVAGPRDSQHVGEAQSHVPAPDDAAPARGWDWGSGDLVKAEACPVRLRGRAAAFRAPVAGAACGSGPAAPQGERLNSGDVALCGIGCFVRVCMPACE
uniref:Protein C10 n=1 Tax=Dromaius novaehollandiae TaxID=8790 RepID=A0A8C4KRW0_DRONO